MPRRVPRRRRARHRPALPAPAAPDRAADRPGHWRGQRRGHAAGGRDRVQLVGRGGGAGAAPAAAASPTCSTRTRNCSSRSGESEETENLTDPDGERRAGCSAAARRWTAPSWSGPSAPPDPTACLRLRVRVENRTEPRVPLRSRDDGLKYSLIAAHLLIGVTGGTLPVADRSAGVGRRRGGRVREHRYLAGAGRPAGVPRPGAVLAGHPLRPPRGGAGERRRPVRRHRDRRDPHPAHAGADRRRSGRRRGRPTRAPPT